MHPAPGLDPGPAGPPGRPARPARVAVVLATAAGIAIVASYVILLLAWAVGGADAVEDTWVGFLGAVSLLGGMLVSLVAFVLAVVAKVRHERWKLLRLPLSFFPVLLATVVLGELFVFE